MITLYLFINWEKEKSKLCIYIAYIFEGFWNGYLWRNEKERKCFWNGYLRRNENEGFEMDNYGWMKMKGNEMDIYEEMKMKCFEIDTYGGMKMKGFEINIWRD